MINLTTKQYSDSACQYFCKGNKKEFISSMTDFYRVGQKNPAVASFHLLSSVRDTVDILSKSSQDAIDIAKDAIKIKSPIFPISQAQEAIDIAKGGVEFAEKIFDNYVVNSLGLLDVLNGKNTELNNLPEKIAFDKKFNELYPRTGRIRKNLIKNLEECKVTKKTSWKSKVIFAKTLDEYEKLYPKTIKVRMALIMDNRIKDNVVTPKLTNIFKKFKYLRKIK